MSVDQFFVNNSKNNPRTITAQIGHNVKIGRHRNAKKQREKWPFSTFNISKLGHFSRYLTA